MGDAPEYSTLRPRFLPMLLLKSPGRLLVGMWLCGTLTGLEQAAGAEPVLRRIYDTHAIVGEAPKIDGVLNDMCWQQGEWAGEFVQREPFERSAPTAPTEIKILYDHRNVYVAIRAHDPEFAREPRLLAQRDNFSGDMVGIAFDSYNNRLTAFEFDVNSAGSKVDLILRNDGQIDLNWNAVWDVKVSATATGWTAEYRIPLSQLRYSSAPNQVWGLHSWRWIRRAQEESNWQLIPMDNPGVVRSFGELRGIRDLPPSRRIEVVPYSVAKYESLAAEDGNPYRGCARSSLDAGLDAKIGLSSDFTLDLTVNPDFGQVEADPSEINLSTVETFFSEKRPFFTEGKAMFEYGLEDDLPFYSRRIGAAPSLTPAGPGFIQMPASTRIVTAEKVTGRSPGGLSLGVLHAMTERVDARVTPEKADEYRELAEPKTNYLVVRAQNEFSGGDTVVGEVFTAAQRTGTNAELGALPRQALTAGLDAIHYWSQRAYFFDARVLTTRVSGSTLAITELMKNAVHNYARPDADYTEVDENAQHLAGNAGQVGAGKGTGGHWRYFGRVSWRSPGVDFNDLGYLANADLIRHTEQLQYFDAEPGAALRRRDFRLKQSSTYNYGGDVLVHSIGAQAQLAGIKNWFGMVDTRVETNRLDTRMLRGGPALRRPMRFPSWLYYESDGARSTQMKLSAGYTVTPEDGSAYYEVEPGVSQRIGDRLHFDLKFGLSRNRQESQYAGESVSNGATQYLVGRMEQRSLFSQFRAEVNFSPTVTLTYFAGPYVSKGTFDRFKRVTRPRARRIEDRFMPLHAVRAGDGYASATAGETITFENPDFTWRELKANLVLRWEFRPGSSLYCVWSQHRADTRDLGSFSGGGEYRRLLDVQPDDTLIVKMSYWFSI